MLDNTYNKYQIEKQSFWRILKKEKKDARTDIKLDCFGNQTHSQTKKTYSKELICITQHAKKQDNWMWRFHQNLSEYFSSLIGI